jgi:hypothetical protein
LMPVFVLRIVARMVRTLMGMGMIVNRVPMFMHVRMNHTLEYLRCPSSLGKAKRDG